MSIWIDRSLGTQEAGLAVVSASDSPAVVFAHPIPADLREVAEPEWHDQRDVLRALGIPTAAPYRKSR